MSRRWTIIWLVFVFSLFLATAIYCFHEKGILLVASEIIIPLLFAVTVILFNRLMKPVITINRSINMLREGDFNLTMVKTGNKETDSLINVYNSMITRLREERISIREKNNFLDLLIESSPMGVIVLDFDEKIMSINRVACRCLGISPEGIAGKTLSDIGSEFAKTISSVPYGKKQSFVPADGRKYLCQRLFFMDHGFRHPFYIIEELTQEIRKAEKEAYGKLIRMMAHEVNNTIGSVNSIMASVISSPESFREPEREEIVSALSVAIQRNYQMNRFMQNFSNVVKLPLPEKGKMDLNNSVRVVADSFGSSVKEKKGEILVSLDPVCPNIFADQSQIEQVLSNIIKNSVDVLKENGKIWVSTSSFPLTISIEDDGPGMDEDIADKIFTPFFSTKPGGQGIGLTLTQEILTNHGFLFSFTNRKGGGTIFTIHPYNRE